MVIAAVVRWLREGGANRWSSGPKLAATASILLVGAGCGQSLSMTGAGGPDTSVGQAVSEYRVVTISDQLERPWSLAFLPDGNVLVTEREGRLRLVRDDALDPRPIAGIPEVEPDGSLGRRNGLLDIALHPRFAENRLLFFTYTKARDDGAVTTVLARARYEGGYQLADVRDVFVADNWVHKDISQTSASRIVFGRDGMLYMSIGAPTATASDGIFSRSMGGRAQDLSLHGGKVLRLREDGTAPADNPFVDRHDARPEIFTYGHRNILGMTLNPETGEIWVAEAGPRDGDEINILRPGANYGWPTVGIGRDYTGDFIGGPAAVGDRAGRRDADRFWMEGMAQPFLFWVPAVTPSGMMFYTADRFPRWSGSLLVGTLGTNQIELIPFNPRGQPNRARYLLDELGQRIRDVRQGPDGLVYVLTDHQAIWSPGDTSRGALLRLEPRR